MSIQKELAAIYERFTDPAAIRHACGSAEAADKMADQLSAPFLIQPSESDMNSDPRVAIAGQETHTWLCKYRDFLKDKKIDFAMKQYEDFHFGRTHNSPFFRYFHQLRRGILGGNTTENDTSVVWLNLFKFDQGSMIRSTHKEAVLKLQGDIFQQEIKLLNPDVIVFLTGPFYDSIITRFYPEARFTPLGNIPDRQVARIESLPCLAFRTYHPGYMNRRRKRTAHCLPAIVEEILGQQ